MFWEKSTHDWLCNLSASPFKLGVAEGIGGNEGNEPVGRNGVNVFCKGVPTACFQLPFFILRGGKIGEEKVEIRF